MKYSQLVMRENMKSLMRHSNPGRRVQSWQDAEHNAAAWMRHWGYTDARAQPGGADGGIDVRSRRALGQVKHQTAAVGRPELQRLFGARGKDMGKQLLFFTGSSYTSTAVAYAAENDIALFVYQMDGSMDAVNSPAHRIAAARPPSRITPPGPAAPQTVPSTAKGSSPRVGRIVLGLLLAGIALAIPGSPGFDPLPNWVWASTILMVIPCILVSWGVAAKGRHKFWPSGLGMFLVDVALGWMCNANLWRGKTSEVIMQGAVTALTLAAALLLIRWNASLRRRSNPATLSDGDHAKH
ncbi:restriction endonuclease [Streptomyces mashuensis]|nr:restriction endonuclease [Streptomyces mashuensis]